MRPVWSAPGSQSIQGINNTLLVQIMNTLKSELATQQEQLLMDHQQEDAVDGGAAGSIMFHHLLAQAPMGADEEVSKLNVIDPITLLPGGLMAFDANQGATGTAEYKFERRVRRKKLR